MGTTKRKKVNSRTIEKQLKDVEKLFRQLERDPNLPTFGEHFMQCLMYGIAEQVNLKKMYPQTYFKLSRWLEQHNRKIVQEN